MYHARPSIFRDLHKVPYVTSDLDLADRSWETGRMLHIELLATSAGNDAALVNEITGLINRVYAVAEAGLWVDGTTRTSAAELLGQIRAGQIAVARVDGQIVGSVRIQRLATGEGEFAALVSAPERRGLGIGGELIAFAERECRRRGATVMQLELLVPRTWSHPTKEFLAEWYTRLGYRKVRVGTIDEAYPDLAPLLATPCDFVIYQKELDRSRPLFRLIWGYMATAVVSTLVRFGLPDLLGERARTSDDLAELTGTHAPSLRRLLRAATGLGLAHEVEPGRFRLSETGSLLRTDVPDSMNAIARVFSSEAMMDGWLELPETVRTGGSRDFFSIMAQRPELAALFHESMSQGTRISTAAITSSYDFSRFRTIVDVGGGSGTLLEAILASAPAARGVLVDLAPARGRDRIEGVERDFFVSIPEGGDLYVLKSVIHDWDDEPARVILRNCRAAMSPGARLLLVERLLPEGAHDDALLFLSDMNMLVNLGGRERTEQEFRVLLDTCHLRLESVMAVRDPAGFHLLEAVPV
jgi:GNAT superfamily N-acetyltransferase